MEMLTDSSSRAINIIASLLVATLILLAMIYGGAIIIPIIFAICVWMILNDTAAAISRIKFGKFQIPMRVSLFIGLAIFSLVFVRIASLLINNLRELVAQLPSYSANVDALLATVPNSVWRVVLGETDSQVDSLITQLAAVATGYFSDSAALVAGSLATVGSTIAYIAVYVLFLLLEQGTFEAKVANMFRHEAKRAQFEHMVESIREQVQTYLRMKTLVSLATAIISYIIMLLFGLEYAFVWAILFFILNFIPNIGSIIAVTFPVVMGLLQFPAITTVVFMLVALTLVQMAIGSFIEPKFLGNQLNISPLVVLIALVVFGTIWGIPGMFLSVPLTVVIMIVLSHFESTRFIAIILSGDGIVHDVEQERAEFAHRHGISAES